MTKIIDKKETEILIARWKAGDKTLELNERVFVLEKLMRRLLGGK